MEKVTISKNEYHVLRDENRLLKEQNAFLLAKLYGPKSERYALNADVVQDCLFEEKLPDLPEDETSAEEVEVPGHKRRKGGRKPISDDLPRQVVELDVAETEKVCGCCGKQRPELPPKTNEVVNYTPAKLDVIRYERKTYGECPTCSGSEEAANGVVTAEPVKQLIPQSIATSSLLAYLMTSKFADGLPFYRQSGILQRQGISLSRATMCNWQQKIGEKTEKLWDFMLEDAKNRDYIQMDETPFQVMKEPGKKDTSKSYMWVIHSPPGRQGPLDAKITLFYYDPTRSSSVPQTLLEGFQGRFHSDGYQGYRFLDTWEGVELLGCWAHARRKFFDAHKAYQDVKVKGIKKPNFASQFLKLIRQLFKLDAEAKDLGLSHDERLKMRSEKATPVVNAIQTLAKELQPKVQPGSKLGNAVIYLNNQWAFLEKVLKYGEVELSTNWVENAIRPFVVGRKGWLFSGSPKGAQSSAIIYSLVETAKQNKWNPQAYLQTLFEKLPLAQSDEDLRALLPYNLQCS